MAAPLYGARRWLGRRKQRLREAFLVRQRQPHGLGLLDGALGGVLHRGHDEVGQGTALELRDALELRALHRIEGALRQAVAQPAGPEACATGSSPVPRTAHRAFCIQLRALI